jgi:hypothetical protein
MSSDYPDMAEARIVHFASGVTSDQARFGIRLQVGEASGGEVVFSTDTAMAEGWEGGYPPPAGLPDQAAGEAPPLAAPPVDNLEWLRAQAASGPGIDEAAWLGAESPDLMLAALHLRLQVRKTRLLLLSHCRRAWRWLGKRSRAAALVAERFTQGEATASELARAELAARRAMEARTDELGDSISMDDLSGIEALRGASYDGGEEPRSGLVVATLRQAAAKFTWLAALPDRPNMYHFAWHELPGERAAAVRNIRCIFGNPFRPVTFDDTWRTPLVASLATAAYEERSLPSGELDPARLSVLADALEEIGANEELVTHLRSSGVHVRGCWAVDLCLGKS